METWMEYAKIDDLELLHLIDSVVDEAIKSGEAVLDIPALTREAFKSYGWPHIVEPSLELDPAQLARMVEVFEEDL